MWGWWRWKWRTRRQTAITFAHGCNNTEYEKNPVNEEYCNFLLSLDCITRNCLISKTKLSHFKLLVTQLSGGCQVHLCVQRRVHSDQVALFFSLNIAKQDFTTSMSNLFLLTSFVVISLPPNISFGFPLVQFRSISFIPVFVHLWEYSDHLPWWGRRIQ